MKRLLVIITLFAALLLSAYDVMLIPTLTVNVADQLQHVPLNRGLFVPSVYSVERGQPFSLYFFIGLKEAAVQDTELAGTLMLKDPAGKKKKLFKDIVLFKLTGKSSGVIAAESRVDAVFEPSDKSGDYEYTLILRDSAGKEKVVKAVVTLADTLIDSTPMDSEKMSDFLHNYYRRPQPGRVFAAWHFYLTSGAKLQQEKEGGRFNPSAVLLSFCEIFKLNPQYHDKLAAMSSSAPVDCHAYYAFVFAGLGKEFLEKYRKVIHPEIMILTDRLNGEDPFAVTAITEPFHADMAWARFFATGEFDVIKMDSWCRIKRKKTVDCFLQQIGP